MTEDRGQRTEEVETECSLAEAMTVGEARRIATEREASCHGPSFGDGLVYPG